MVGKLVFIGLILGSAVGIDDHRVVEEVNKRVEDQREQRLLIELQQVDQELARATRRVEATGKSKNIWEQAARYRDQWLYENLIEEK